MTVLPSPLNQKMQIQGFEALIQAINNYNPATAQSIGQILWGQTAAEVTAGVTPTNYAYPPGNVLRYGTNTTPGTTDMTAAIQAAFDSNATVYIPETCLINTAVNLRSNLSVTFAAGAGIVMASGVTTEYMLRGATVSNVFFYNGTITGNGLAGLSSVYLTSCTNIKFDTCSITKAGAMAILTTSGTKITAFNCNLSENYFYGVDDRDGVGNKYIANRFISNGDTGVATSTGGRGINLWRSTGAVVDDNDFIESTEYGCRLYSEAADATASYANRIVNNRFQDNAGADFLLYDESGAGTLILKNVVANNTAIRSTNPTLGASFLLQGADNDIDNCHVYKTGTIGAFVAFNMNDAFRQRMKGCSAHNVNDALGFSDATNCEVDNFSGNGVATVAGVAGFVGAGNILRNSKFVHGGAGASDVALPTYNGTGRNTVDSCEFDGFHTGLYLQQEAVTLINNKTLNSDFAGLRKDGDGQAGQEMIGNIFDIATPSFMQFLERKAAGVATTYDTAAPATKTWAVGDRCYNSAPSGGNPKSWVCTAAGTPGTWVSEGAL